MYHEYSDPNMISPFWVSAMSFWYAPKYNVNDAVLVFDRAEQLQNQNEPNQRENDE